MTPADAFRARILAADSVTLAMSAWCRERAIGTLPLRSRVHRRAALTGAPEGFPIAIGRDEPVWFRQITLMAGNVCLLDADNHFLPERLAPPAVARLRDSDTPFGAALVPGRQSRRTTRIIVPPDAVRPAGPVEVSAEVAVLTLQGIVDLDDRPVAWVEERFRPGAVG